MNSGRKLRFLIPLALAFFGILLIGLSGCSEMPVRRGYTPAQDPVAERDPKAEALKRAHSYYATGEYGNAMTSLGLVSEEKLTDAEKTDYYNLKGLIRLAEKNHPAAVINFKKAVASNPVKEYSSFYEYNLATAHAEAGNFDEAKLILAKLDPTGMPEAEQKKVVALKDKVAKRIKPESTAAQGIHAVIPAPATPGETPQAETGPVYAGESNGKKIGLLLPLSGKYENFGKKVQRSVELAFQTSTDTQAKSYELIAVDAGGSPESHLEGLKKLVEEHQVIAIIGPVLGKTLEAIKTRAEYYQTPMISVAQAQGALSPNIFSCSISVKDQVEKIVAYAMETREFKRFAILAPANNAGRETAKLFWDEVAEKRGEIRGFELYDPDLTDFREPVDKIVGLHYSEPRNQEWVELAEKRKELNITKKTMKTIQYFSLPPIQDFDAVFIADEAKTVGQIIPTFAYRDAKSVNFMGISSWNSTQLIQRAGDLVEGAFFPVAFNIRNPPEATRRFYDLYSTTYNSHPGELDAVAFDSAAMLIQGLSKSPASRSELTKILEDLKDTEGATGEISMDGHRCARNLTLYGIKKGSFEVLESSTAR
jgi:ABC-type branched-subunit amino acid transport system substrate-binding protein